MGVLSALSRLLKAALGFGAVCLVAAGVGLAVYAAYFHTPGPVYRYPVGVGMLLCCVLVVCSVQTVLLSWGLIRAARIQIPDSEGECWDSMCCRTYDVVYFVAMTTVAVFYFIGSCVGQPWTPPDGVVWSLVLVLVNAANALLSWARRKEAALRATVTNNLPMKAVTKVVKRAGYVLNGCLRALVLLFFGMMLGGAWIQGIGYAQHGGSAAPGTFLEVRYGLGTQRFHVWCDGPVNASRPTVWLETGGGHTLYDLLGIQRGLTRAGWRACAYDKPGMGLSDYGFANQDDSYHYPLIQATGERGPFVVAAWGGGVNLAWEFARTHRENVTSLILMDCYDDDFEFRQERFVRNLTDAEMERKKEEDLRSRVFLHDVIRTVGVQWGLMSIFAGGGADKATFQPPEYYDAFRFLNSYNEKSWTYQFFGLLDHFRSPYPFGNNTVGRDVPLFVMASRTNGTAQCIKNRQPLDSQACRDTIRRHDYAYEYKLGTATYTDQSQVATCQGCTLGFPVEESQWTTGEILRYLDGLPAVV
ncbi:Hypp823 [Branchiostoma lanceolatum]|uniref:Hypp823 protein n=1 Tax=Branchiostoma lanceolatum TaxID=7740 RepID=A0A8J9VCK8_BRALA|nr:Hypp823 [Branchiostoma lanceolatum]